MRFLIDNMVTRDVRTYLRQRGHAVVPVRRALRQNASDQEIAAFAAAKRWIVVTHDAGMARRARRSGIQHIFLRVPEPDAGNRLRIHIDEIEGYLTGTALRVTVFKRTIQADLP